MTVSIKTPNRRHNNFLIEIKRGSLVYRESQTYPVRIIDIILAGIRSYFIKQTKRRYSHGQDEKTRVHSQKDAQWLSQTNKSA